ncbi:MAG: hypothetical protein HKN19_01715 [Halioglobus sp.]|nr:hypothetical protein [Halioglobus sp.]
MNAASTGATVPIASTPGKIVTLIYLVAAAALLATLLHNHYQVLNFPHPLDFNEGAVLTVTATIVEGGNPYSLESQPARTSVYPAMGNLVAAPFAAVFGNTFFLHRLIAMVLIVASSLLVGAVVFRKTSSWAASFVAGVFAYASFIYYSTPIGGPNGLSLFLFLASVIIPWCNDFSRRSLAVAIVVGVLAFYTKQYFVAGLGYVALYLFLARSKKAGVLFGVAFTAALLLSALVVMVIAPYYFDITLISVIYTATEIGSMDVMLKQLIQYSGYVYPFYVVLGLYLARLAWLSWRQEIPDATAQHPSAARLNLTDLDAPLLPRGVDYFLVCLLCSLVIFVFVLGTNPGMYLSYLFQMISPFLVILVIGLMAQMGRLAIACQLVLLPAMYHHYAMQSHDFSVKHAENWPKLQKIIDESEHVYASNILLERVLRSGKEIYQNGATTYFVFTFYKPDILKRADYAVSVDGIWERHVKRVHDLIRRREFDAVLVNPWTPLPMMPPGSGYAVNGRELLEQYYEKKRLLPLAAANRPGGGSYPIEIWRPREGEIAPAN